MPKRSLGIAIVGIAVTIIIWALFFRGSEEDRIRAAIVKAAAAVKVIPGENPVMRAARVKGDLVDVMEKDVAFSVPELNDVGKGRDPLVGAAISISSVFEEADVNVVFSQVTIEPGGHSAAATTTVTLSAMRGGQRERDVRKVSFVLRKDAEWRISEVTVYPKE
ncbi:MAG: hypothetical protein ACXVEF_04115 [Polyangiales bacterium]